MDYITLNNGVRMPQLGFGVYQIPDAAECQRAVEDALSVGYRLLDTAASYGNEEAVGAAIRASGLPRDEVFVTTKLWMSDVSYEGAKRGFDASLKRLGLDYIDLYLIHQPYHDYYGAWRAMEELYAEGKVRAIGVDNFTQDRLADFLFWNKVKPAVNLLECNTFFQRENERTYLEREGIQMQAWSPLAAGQGKLFENETLCAIANAHSKSVAQVVLRWLVQRNIVVLPKSTHRERMEQNIDVFDFTLSDEEMAAVTALDTKTSLFFRHDTPEAVDMFVGFIKERAGRE